MAHGHGKRVDDVTGLGVPVFEQGAEGGEQARQRVGQRVQLPVEAALIQAFLAPVLLHVALSQRQVAAKIAGREQGRGQHLRVRQVPAWVDRPGPNGAGLGEQIIEEAVHCDGLFSHGERGMRKSNTSNLVFPCRDRLFLPR